MPSPATEDPKGTSPVGSFALNGSDFVDMAGEVRAWTCDRASGVKQHDQSASDTEDGIEAGDDGGERGLRGIIA